MSDLVLTSFVTAQLGLTRVASTSASVLSDCSRRLRRRCHLPHPLDDRGEGVISAALAVLIMAFLGALMWVAFKAVFTGATTRTKDQVELIGS